MSDASLSGNLPHGDANGLTVIIRDLIDNPHKLHVLIAIADCRKVTTDNDTGEIIPTVRIRRIEVVRVPGDLKTAEKLMRRALENRSGMTVLPLDLEDDVRRAFAEIEEQAGSGGDQ